MKRNFIIYYGSQQIVEVPKYGIGKNIMTTGRNFTVRRMANLRKSELVP